MLTCKNLYIILDENRLKSYGFNPLLVENNQKKNKMSLIILNNFDHNQLIELAYSVSEILRITLNPLVTWHAYMRVELVYILSSL